MANPKTLKEILSLTPAERRAQFAVSGANSTKHIDYVEIDGVRFTDYTAFSFLWEKTLIDSPERSENGVIENLDSYPWFVTPHLKIDFSLMSIEAYRQIMRMIYARNEFLVTCYDVVNDTMAKHRMYFATEEMPKLWNIVRVLNGADWVELLGVEDYSVELIGTNVALDPIIISYFFKGEKIGEQKVIAGNDIVIGSGIIAPGVFAGTWSDSLGVQYIHGSTQRFLTDTILNADF